MKAIEKFKQHKVSFRVLQQCFLMFFVQQISVKNCCAKTQRSAAGPFECTWPTPVPFAWKPIVHHWLPQWFPHCLANAHLCCKVDTALQKLWGQYLPKQYLSKTLHIFSCTPKRTIKTNTRLIAIPLLITKQPHACEPEWNATHLTYFKLHANMRPRHDLHGLLNKYRIHDIPENLWGDEARARPGVAFSVLINNNWWFQTYGQLPFLEQYFKKL